MISMELLSGNEKLRKSASLLIKWKSKRGTKQKYKITSDMENMEVKENIPFSHMSFKDAQWNLKIRISN